MSETIEPKSLNKKDIIEAFSDRVLWKPEKVEKEYLGLDENLMEKDLVGSDVADRYEQAQINDKNTFDQISNMSKEFFDRFDFYERAAKPISARLLKTGNDPITLITNKYMEHYKLKSGEEGHGELFNLRIFRGDFTDLDAKRVSEARMDQKKHVGDFVLSRNKNSNLSVSHRYIQPIYRRPQNNGNETLGNIGLKACEQIAQSCANKKERVETLEVSTGQLSVMIWLYNNGYEPKTEQDKERLEKIINADENLVVVEDNFVWEKDKWVSGTNVFQEREKSFTVNFKKNIEPNLKAMAENVREKAEEILKIKNIQASTLVQLDREYYVDLINRDTKQKIRKPRNLDDPDYRYFTVLSSTGEKLGIIGIYDKDKDKNAIDIIVDPKYRGAGLAKQFYDLIMDQLDLPFVTLTIDFDPNDPDGKKRRTNASSMKAAEKLPDVIRINDPFYEKLGKAKFIYPRHRKI